MDVIMKSYKWAKVHLTQGGQANFSRPLVYIWKDEQNGKETSLPKEREQYVKRHWDEEAWSTRELSSLGEQKNKGSKSGDSKVEIQSYVP